MKILKAIVTLVLSILFRIILMIPQAIITVLQIVEGSIRITRKTLQFLIMQIEDEVLDKTQLTYGKSNEKN